MDGWPYRLKGASAFRLLDRFWHGESIDPFLDAYPRANIFRVWPYVTWPDNGWPVPPPTDVVRAFLAYLADRGRQVELTLLTDDDPARLPWAQQLVQELASGARPTNLLPEAGNEPISHKNINTQALRDVLNASGFLYATGHYEDYEDPRQWYGSYMTVHTARDAEWMRKSKDLREWHDGWPVWTSPDGVVHLAFPGTHKAVVAGEPIRPDQAGFLAQDFYTYALVASLMGAGAYMHTETGKQALLPTPEERPCIDAFYDGLAVFPPDAPLGAYDRIDEHGGTLRTYTVGPWMVRVRPRDPQPPAGWTTLDEWGIACQHA
jgi:hypothetical protein